MYNQLLSHHLFSISVKLVKLPHALSHFRVAYIQFMVALSLTILIFSNKREGSSGDEMFQTDPPIT